MQIYWDQLGCLEKSWKACCYSDFSENHQLQKSHNWENLSLEEESRPSRP